MRIAKLKKINHSVLQKKTPLLGFTVLELVILWLVITGGAAAIVITRHQSPTAVQDTNASQPKSQNTYSTSDTSPQPQQPTGTAQQNSPKPQSSGTATTSNLPDQYGCIPQTSGYDNCVKYAKQNALTLSCDSRAKAAGDTYSATEDQAQAAYDAVMAEWNAVKDQPYQTHSPYNEYATDAKTKYNAIQKPAYATYVSTLNSLNAQGCSVIKTYSDTSWAGY